MEASECTLSEQTSQKLREVYLLIALSTLFNRGRSGEKLQVFEPKLKATRWDMRRELELLDLWEKERLYEFTYTPEDEVIAIDTPPPYTSGRWHVGAAAHYTQIDMIARYFRLKGYRVLVPFYADRNGLPVEVQVEKKKGVKPHEVAKTPEGRLLFLNMCREQLDEIERELVKIWRRLGCSFQYWRNGTDSEEYRRITQATFIELYKKGLIYKAERPVNWCPRCRTALAEAELEYEPREDYLYYLVFAVEEIGEKVVVATTRPELLRSCMALVFNPNDSRYSHLKGLHAVNPLYGHRMPILTHESVNPNFGTGLVMVCSYGDHEDVRMFRDLGLTPLVIVDKDGKMREEAGPLAGLTVEGARRKVVEILEERGLLVKKEKILHRVPVCWRCKTPVQIIHATEWFLKQLEFRDSLLELIEKIDFKPPMHKAKLVDWITSVSSDWPISRDRYYATEVPVWYCKKCGEVLLPEPGAYYRPWIDPPPWNKCPKCGASRSELVGETKVFDTWFDSSISVLYVTGYLRDQKLFEKSFSNALRPQGVDIIRTWLYYSLLRVYQLTGKPAFKWVRVTGMGLDEKGEAMHKSKGNIIDPEPYVEKYGADAVRFWAAISAKLGYDYRFSENTIKSGLLFATKLWNIARFVSSFPEPHDYALRPIDKATLALVNRLVVAVDRGYSDLDVYVPVNELYQFTWNYFASHYLELVKNRAYNYNGKYSELEQKGAWYTLHYTLRRILIMLSPIMPFITDAIYRELYKHSVHCERFPEPEDEYLKIPEDLAVEVQRVNHTIWRYKKSIGVKLSEPLKGEVYLDAKFKAVADELIDLHGFERLAFYEKEPPKDTIKLGEGVYIKFS
jgi:valyl-tRNA synthetase